MLTVNGDVNERDMRGAVNEFLRENFPSAQALVAVHQNTAHIHAHVYVHARQLDGKKVDLKQDYFKLDEKWARICAERFRDPSIYQDHMRLKAETRDYRRRERMARTSGGTVPDKPDRWTDRYEILHGPVKPWDDRFVGRLMAAARVAAAKAEYLRLTEASPSHVTEADREAGELKDRLQAISAKRALSRSESKRTLPAEVITVEEQKEIARYTSVIREKKARRGKKVRAKEQHPMQTSFDFKTEHAQQLTLRFGTPHSSKRRSKAKDQSNLTSGLNRAVENKSHNNERDRVMVEREILGRAMVTGSEVERLSAELTQAREYGTKWRLKIYDATHKRDRVISEFEIRRRCEARATQVVHSEGAINSAERQRKYQHEFDGELTKHRLGIAHHRELVSQSIQGLEEQLSSAQQEYEFYRPQALEIQARYAANNTQPPLPILTSTGLIRLQDQAIIENDAKRFLAVEKIREGLAVERGEPTRTDDDLARLRGHLMVAGSDAKTHAHRGEEFEHTRHLTHWEIGGGTWSLAEIDQQLGRLQDQARILVNPQALIPQLSHPMHEAARLAVTLGKNLNLSPAKCDQAAREIDTLLGIRAQVENQISARSQLLRSETKSASDIHEALVAVSRKEVSLREHSGKSVPSPTVTGAELSRLGTNALVMKDDRLLKEFHTLEEEHFRRETGGEKTSTRKLCGRAAGREVVAEIMATESKEKLQEFVTRKKFAQVLVNPSHELKRKGRQSFCGL